MRGNLIVTPGCGPLILRPNDPRVLELARPLPVRRVLRRDRRPARWRCGCCVIRTRCCAICRAARSISMPWAWCTRRCCRWCRSSRSRSPCSRPSARIASCSRSSSSSSGPWATRPAEFTQKVMEFADSVSTGLLGSLGLALLLWTLLGTIKKVEDGFNFLWRVEATAQLRAARHRIRRAAHRRAHRGGELPRALAQRARNRDCGHRPLHAVLRAAGRDSARWSRRISWWRPFSPRCTCSCPIPG